MGLNIRRTAEQIIRALAGAQGQEQEVDPSQFLNHPNADIDWRVRRGGASAPVEMPAPSQLFENSPDTMPGRPVPMPGAGQPPAAGGGLRVRRPSGEGGDVMNAPSVPGTGGEAARLHPPTGALDRMREDLEARPPAPGVVDNSAIAQLEMLNSNAGEFNTQRRADRAQAAAPPAAGPAGVAPAPAAVAAGPNANDGAASGASLDESQLRELLGQQRRLYADRGSNKGGGIMANLGVVARRLAPAMQGIGDDAGAGEFFGRLAGAAAPAVANAIRPELAVDERDALQDERARVDGEVGLAVRRHKTLADLEDDSLGRDYKRAQIDDLRVRKPKEQAAKAAAQERNFVLANLRVMKGQKLDPSNPQHTAFLKRAEAAGVTIDPDEWNSSKSNVVKLTVVDDADPTRTNVVLHNTVTGEQNVVGRAGYVTPIHKDTELTTHQELTHDERTQARADANARFEKTFGLGVQRFEETMRRGLSADAARTFGIEARGQFERVRAIERQIADLERRKAENLIRKGEADERINALRDEATGIGTQIEGARAKALRASGGLSVRRPSSPAAGAAIYTEDDVRARARAAGKNEDAAVQNARARGLIRE